MARYSPLLTSARRRVRTMTNNPERGSNSWPQLIPGVQRVRPPLRSLRGSVRRLMKVDPSNAQGTPDSQLLARANGEAGRTGGRSMTIMGRSETKRVAESPAGGTSRTGVRSIRNRGVNRGIIKR